MVGARRYSRQGAGCAGGGGSVPDIFSFDECAWFASLHLDLFPFLYLVSDLCAITLLLAKESQLLLPKGSILILWFITGNASTSGRNIIFANNTH
jgi:hypothetical protein